MFDRDTLWNQVYFALEKAIDDPVMTDYLADRICDAVSEWCPKQGDFWLTSEGKLYVNRGWHEVTPAGVSPEGLQSIAKNDTFKDLTI
jgi:hypothetical protein